MFKGKVQMGTAAQTLLQWDQDALDDCSPEDRVWGWSVRSSEVLHHDRTKIDDKALVKMLYQGLLDKQPGAPAWTEPTSIKHGVRFMSNMVVRVVQRCLRMDDKVQHLGRLSFVMYVDKTLFLDQTHRRGTHSCYQCPDQHHYKDRRRDG